MGHRHSRPKAPHRDISVTAATRCDARLTHDSNPRRDVSTKSHRWKSVRKPDLPSESQPESARCTNADQPASLIEPQSILEPMPPSTDYSPCRIDSLRPLETSDRSTRDSGPSEQVKETSTTPQIQSHDPSSALPPIVEDIIEPLQAAVAPSEQIEECLTTSRVHTHNPSSAPGLDITDFFKQSHAPVTPSYVFVGNAGSSTAAKSNNAPVVPTFR